MGAPGQLRRTVLMAAVLAVPSAVLLGVAAARIGQDSRRWVERPDPGRSLVRTMRGPQQVTDALAHESTWQADRIAWAASDPGTEPPPVVGDDHPVAATDDSIAALEGVDPARRDVADLSGAAGALRRDLADVRAHAAALSPGLADVFPAMADSQARYAGLIAGFEDAVTAALAEIDDDATATAAALSWHAHCRSRAALALELALGGASPDPVDISIPPPPELPADLGGIAPEAVAPTPGYADVPPSEPTVSVAPAGVADLVARARAAEARLAAAPEPYIRLVEPHLADTAHLLSLADTLLAGRSVPWSDLFAAYGSSGEAVHTLALDIADLHDASTRPGSPRTVTTGPGWSVRRGIVAGAGTFVGITAVVTLAVTLLGARRRPAPAPAGGPLAGWPPAPVPPAPVPPTGAPRDGDRAAGESGTDAAGPAPPWHDGPWRPPG